MKLLERGGWATSIGSYKAFLIMKWCIAALAYISYERITGQTFLVESRSLTWHIHDRKQSGLNFFKIEADYMVG